MLNAATVLCVLEMTVLYNSSQVCECDTHTQAQSVHLWKQLLHYYIHILTAFVQEDGYLMPVYLAKGECGFRISTADIVLHTF